MEKIDARDGLRLHHVLILERVMVALKRAHSCSIFDNFVLVFSRVEDGKYKLIEDDKYIFIKPLSMSGHFSGPPSLSHERIHGVMANPL